MSVERSIKKFRQLLTKFQPVLASISNEAFGYKPFPAKWSKQEILGHLIDSATNNHQRFIRIQYENNPVIYYDQNRWNDLSHYQTAEKPFLISLWLIYNQHLLNIIEATPDSNLERIGTGCDGQKHPLKWYIEDYLAHMEHHLQQIISV